MSTYSKEIYELKLQIELNICDWTITKEEEYLVAAHTTTMALEDEIRVNENTNYILKKDTFGLRS